MKQTMHTHMNVFHTNTVIRTHLCSFLPITWQYEEMKNFRKQNSKCIARIKYKKSPVDIEFSSGQVQIATSLLTSSTHQ